MKSQRALNLRTIFLAVLVVVTSCSKETKEETNVSAPVKTSHSKVSEAMNIETEMQSDAELEKLENEIETQDIAKAKVEEVEQEKVVQKITKKKVAKKKASVKAKKVATKKIEKKEELKEDAVKTSQASIATSKVDLATAKSKTEKKVSQLLDVSYETDRYEGEDKSSADATIWYFLYYKLSSDYTARLWLNFTKDMHKSNETTVNDTKITFSKSKIDLLDRVSLTPSLTVIAPTSEKSKRNEEMITGVEINPSLLYKVTDKLSFNYLPRMVKNFHEYETSRTNKINTEYKLIQFFVLNYSITEKLYIEPTLIYSNTWGYTGTRRDPSYLTIWEVGHNTTENLTLAAGVSTSGSVYQVENGKDNNVELFDENSSTVYGKFALKF